MNAANGVSTVELKNKNGLLDEKRRYTVGVNSFIACQYMKNIAAIPEELPTTAAIALTQYFIRHPKVNYQNVQRVFLR